MQDQLGDSPDYVSHALLQGLEGAAKPNTLHDLGITKQDDRKLILQADVLEGQLNQPNGIDRKSLLDLTSFASSLVSSIDRLQQLPSVFLVSIIIVTAQALWSVSIAAWGVFAGSDARLVAGCEDVNSTHPISICLH